MEVHRRPIEPGRSYGWLVLVLLTILVAGGAFWLARVINGENRTEFDPSGLRTVTPRGNLSEHEESIIEIFENGRRSVVGVASSATGVQRQPFGGARTVAIPKGSGTGIVWDTDGHIVTNYHVIEAEGRSTRGRIAPVQPIITVQLPGYRNPVLAEVRGTAPDYDLAVIKVKLPSETLFPITIGESADLRVGQTAVAIGNPFDLPHTLTTGVISALGRRMKSRGDRVIEEVIQTDASINPGNSGGPLLDSAGRLIGVNTAILSENGANQGIGFAIPVDTVNWVVAQLIRQGELKRVQLGINATATSQMAVPPRVGGIYVAQVIANSAAARAGLRGHVVDRKGRLTQEGDVITHVNGMRTLSHNQLYSALEMASQKGELTLRIWRDGKTIEKSVAIDRKAGRSG